MNAAQTVCFTPTDLALVRNECARLDVSPAIRAIIAAGLACAELSTANHPGQACAHSQTRRGEDSALAALMRMARAKGVATISACEDGMPADYCVVVFASLDSAQRFVSIATRRASDALVTHIAGIGVGAWVYTVSTRDAAHAEGSYDVAFQVTVRFPRSDVPALEACFAFA